MESNDTSAATSPLPDVPIYASDIEMSAQATYNTCTFNIGPPTYMPTWINMTNGFTTRQSSVVETSTDETQMEHNGIEELLYQIMHMEKNK
jgi:hypothetical protein